MTNLENFLHARCIRLQITLYSNAPDKGWTTAYQMYRGSSRDVCELVDQSGSLEDVRPLDWVINDILDDIGIADKITEPNDSTKEIKEHADRMRHQFLKCFTEEEIGYLIHTLH